MKVFLLCTTVVVVCFFSFLPKEVLKYGTIALDVEIWVSMECKITDSDEPLTSESGKSLNKLASK